MKKIYKDKIVNINLINKTNKSSFIFDYLNIDYKSFENNKVQVIYMSDLLEFRKNNNILKNVKNKPAIYSNVFSPKDELEIFEELFIDATKNNKKIHIIWVTLKEEVEILEKYYTELWFLREDINCFTCDFRIPLVTVSVKIENLMWKWSDYKAYQEKIFFNPPIRESGQVKAMFKWINRWVIAWIYIYNYNSEVKQFLQKCIKEEKILAITLAKIINYNLEEIGFKWNLNELEIVY